MRRLAKTAVFTALALAVSAAEGMIPISLIIPVPGLKLGFANIVTIFILFTGGFPTALTVTLLRCILGAFFASAGLISAAYSLAGGLCSLAVMTVMKSGVKNIFSLYGISMAGAATHNAAQICVAAFLLWDRIIFAYLPLLLAASIFTGALTAAITGLVLARFQKPDLADILG